MANLMEMHHRFLSLSTCQIPWEFAKGSTGGGGETGKFYPVFPNSSLFMQSQWHSPTRKLSVYLLRRGAPFQKNYINVQVHFYVIPPPTPDLSFILNRAYFIFTCQRKSVCKGVCVCFGAWKMVLATAAKGREHPQIAQFPVPTVTNAASL